MLPVLRIATRGSALARWQAAHVAGLLGLPTELVVVRTTGDRRLDVPIHALGSQGVFVKEVQAAVLDGRADMAVHSAKDLPSGPQAGLVLAAVPERGDPRDALVGSCLAALASGASVATGSVRRRAQLLALRPDLVIEDLRGNIDTRLAQLPRFAGLVMAVAALERLGRSGEISEALDPDVMLPQVAQGALAVECRATDDATVNLLARIDHGPSHRAVRAERAFLSHFGSGCDLPVGAWARATP
ncbi:MAG: hydroxymethylbilane synthase, partial [Acidimicrobiales bacterium]